MRTIVGIAILAAVSAAPVSQAEQGALARQRERQEAAQQKAEEHVAQFKETLHTFSELARTVGALPDRCEPLDDSHRLCSWAVYKRMSGYSWLAAMVKTSKVVNLVCELPNDNSERAAGSCTTSSPNGRAVHW